MKRAAPQSATAIRPGVIAAAFVLLAAASYGARTSPPDAQPSPHAPARMTSIDQLRRDLQQIFTASDVDHAQWGVKIESLGSGETLYSYNAFKFLLPASTQKLLSAAVAAERLGWDYSYTTRLLATGPIDAGGTLHGDLVVVGNGDPTINPRHAARWRVFELWASALRNRGVRAVNGRLIGDDDAFVEPGLGVGWTWENLPYGFGTAIGALQFNENQVLVTITPGSPGSPPVIQTLPAFHGMAVQNRAVTVTAGGERTIDVARLPGASVLQVIGDIPADATPVSITASVENPTDFYLNALDAALTLHGITVSGGVADVDDLPQPIDLTRATELIVDRSPPLIEIIDVCLKWSRNEYAETLLRSLAPPGAAAAAGTALEVMRAQLTAWAIPSTFVVPADGSGLSRQDYVTAHALTQLLTYLWRDPKHADLFRSTLPVAGVSGTLADRMKETPLAGRVWAKTGTLNNVRSLAGYLTTRSGEPIVFSMLANNFQVPADEIDAAMETALLRVHEFARSK